MNDRELLQQALDALEKHIYEYETIEAIKVRLAQPEPEYKECRHCGFECRPNNNQSKKWYPLE